MAAKVKLCVYCANPLGPGDKTREHFVPKRLWAGPRPARTVTAPAHKECNAAFSTDDEFFRNILVAMQGADRHSEACALIEGAVTRCYTKRPHLLASHLQNLGQWPVFSPSGLFAGNTPGFEVDTRRLHRVLEKVVRGLFYSKKLRPLAPAHVVEWFHVDDSNVAFADRLVQHMSGPEGFGDDVFLYRHYLSQVNEDNSCWLLVFYRVAGFVVRTVPKMPCCGPPKET
jgi:hypothetical protein